MATAIPALTTLTNATVASATDVGGNFTSIRNTVNADVLWLTKTGQTMTQTMTWSALQTFSVGLTVTASGLTITAGGLTVSADGITVTGNSTITGTLGSITTLTATTGSFTTLSGAVNFSGTPTFAAGITVTGNSTITGTLGSITTLSCTTVTATNLGGTLSTAAQANVTSVGTLTGLTVSGAVNLSAAAGTIAIGATSTAFQASGSDLLTMTPGTGNFIVAFGDISDGTMAADVVFQPPAADTSTKGFLRVGVLSTAPTGAAADGCLLLDTAAHRLYARSGGVWKYAALT